MPNSAKKFSFDTPEKLKFEIAKYEFMKASREILARANPARPETITLAVQILMMAAEATSTELSEACRYSASAISRWRNGIKLPQPEGPRIWIHGEFLKLLDEKITERAKALSIQLG